MAHIQHNADTMSMVLTALHIEVSDTFRQLNERRAAEYGSASSLTLLPDTSLHVRQDWGPGIQRSQLYIPGGYRKQIGLLTLNTYNDFEGTEIPVSVHAFRHDEPFADYGFGPDQRTGSWAHVVAHLHRYAPSRRPGGKKFSNKEPFGKTKEIAGQVVSEYDPADKARILLVARRISQNLTIVQRLAEGQTVNEAFAAGGRTQSTVPSLD